MPLSENIDLFNLISRHRLIFSYSFFGKIYRRLIILGFALKGKAKFSARVLSLLPYKFVPRKHLPVVNSLLSSVIAQKLFNQDFKKPFKILDYEFDCYWPETKDAQDLLLAALGWEISSLMVLDQYCAKEFLKNDSVVIDVGSNIGLFSLFASRICPNGQIYSFEPNSKNFSMFQRNILKNQINNIKVFPYALGNEGGTRKLFKLKEGLDSVDGGATLEDSSFNYQNPLYDTDVKNSESVKLITLDEFVEQEKLTKVGFIKIDTEGYEKQVINGAKQTIKRFSPVIACSAYHFKNDKTDIPKLVSSFNKNYKYKLIKRAELDFIFWPK